MRCSLILAALATIAFAQSDDPFKPKPPAGVDQALRARIQQFYDLHVKAQYRKAEDLVAEDTKEFFYSHEKPKYLSCEVSKVDYSDKFTKAMAVVTCERYVMMPGFAGKPMKVPETSTWKLENGNWVWFVRQDGLQETPFGIMKAGEFPKNGDIPAPPSLANMPTNADFLIGSVKLEPSTVKLKPGDSAEVTILNGALGPVEVGVPAKLRGIETKFDSTTVKGQGKVTLTIHAAKDAKSGVLNIEVNPIAQTLPIQITVIE